MTYKRETICDECGAKIEKFNDVVTVNIKYGKWDNLFKRYLEETKRRHFHIACYRKMPVMPPIYKTVADEKRDWRGRIKHD